MSKRTRRRRQFEDLRIIVPYCRQSRARDNEQAGTALSLDAQESMIREWGQRNQYIVEAAIRDHDEDSEAIDRAGLAQLYPRIRPGITVAVELWDRLGRGWPLSAINAEIEKRGGRTVSVTQGSDPLSRELHGMMGGQYLIQLSDRLHSVARTRVDRGQHVGATPYGYTRPLLIPYTDKHGQPKVRNSGPLIIEPNQADVIRMIFARVIAGDSIRAVAKALAGQGIASPSGGTWTPETVSWVIKNPVYAGGVRMGERINWDSQHEPIISRETYDTAQLRLERSPIVRTSHPRHWCEGYVRHSCGSRMLMNLVSRPGGGRYPSYRCSESSRAHSTCHDPRQHIGAPLLDRAVRACLTADLSAVVPVDVAIAHAVIAAGGNEIARERQRLTAQRTEVLRVMSRAKMLWQTGTDDLDAWKAQEREFHAQLATIDRAIADLPAEPDRRTIAEAHARISGAPPLDLVSDDVIRAILAELGTIIVSGDGVRIAYHRPYDLLIPSCLVTP